jgi:translation initiation factor IF-1
MQRPYSTRPQKHLRRSHENGHEIKGQANGKEKEIKWLQFDLI